MRKWLLRTLEKDTLNGILHRHFSELLASGMSECPSTTSEHLNLSTTLTFF